MSRGKRNKEEDEQSRPIEETADAPRIDGDRSADARSLRRSWAQLIKRIYEVDPLQCPSCGGEMKVVAFITEHEVVDRILRHLKRKEEGKERAPPG